MAQNDWKLYANVGEGSDVKSTENGFERNQIVHISSAITVGKENIEINTLDDFQKILSDNPRINHVMYYFGSYPRRGTSIEKSEKWIKKLIRDKAKINQQRQQQNAQGAN